MRLSGSNKFCDVLYYSVMIRYVRSGKQQTKRSMLGNSPWTHFKDDHVKTTEYTIEVRNHHKRGQVCKFIIQRKRNTSNLSQCWSTHVPSIKSSCRHARKPLRRSLRRSSPPTPNTTCSNTMRYKYF